YHPYLYHPNGQFSASSSGREQPRHIFMELCCHPDPLNRTPKLIRTGFELIRCGERLSEGHGRVLGLTSACRNRQGYARCPWLGRWRVISDYRESARSVIAIEMAKCARPRISTGSDRCV